MLGLGPVRRAGERVHAGRGALSASLRRPGAVVGVALALAVLGWVADTQTKVVSDIPKLVPQDTRSLRDLRALQGTTGVSGEIDVLVQARDITDPEVVRWMAALPARRS